MSRPLSGGDTKMLAENFTRNLKEKHQNQTLNKNSTFWVLDPFLAPL
jgi:hypothetical protein